MKRFTTLFLLSLLIGPWLYGQGSKRWVTHDQLSRQVTMEEKIEQFNYHEPLTTAKTIVPDPSPADLPLGVQSSHFVELGRSSNAFTILRMEQNQVVANDDLGLVGFIHRHDVTIYGGGSAENGKYRYDLSTDGGGSFTSDIGVLNATYSLAARYPNLTVYNPTGNSNPFSANMVYSGPTLAPGNSWDGHVVGVSDINPSGATATENYLFNGDKAYLPGGLTEGLPGEFWTVDREFIDPDLEDTLWVYKGTWNSATSDIDWIRFAGIDPLHDKGFDGNEVLVGPNIAFGPGGQHGYIAWLGDLANQGNGKFSLQPCFIKTTDGGVTWGSPTEVDLDQIPWIQDTLQSLWINVDTLTGDTVPAGSGDATCGFDFDLTVDANGTAHLGVVIGNSPSGGGYSISSGLAKFIGDVQWDGTNLDVAYISACLAFRGEFGSPVPPNGDLLTLDNAVQVSRTEDGTKIFFSWVDSDTSLIGFGESNNIAPNSRIAGLRITDGYQTPVVKITDGDFNFDGLCLTPTMAPTVLSRDTVYHLPIVFLDMITNNQLEPCKFWYMGNEARLADACFEDPALLNLSFPGHIHIDSLSCIPSSLEEDLATPNLQHTIFPNPTQGQATLRFELPSAGSVSYNLVDMMGKEVIAGASVQYAAGLNDIQINTSQLAPGLYFYNLKVGNQVFSNKLVINR